MGDVLCVATGAGKSEARGGAAARQGDGPVMLRCPGSTAAGT